MQWFILFSSFFKISIWIQLLIDKICVNTYHRRYRLFLGIFLFFFFNFFKTKKNCLSINKIYVAWMKGKPLIWLEMKVKQVETMVKTKITYKALRFDADRVKWENKMNSTSKYEQNEIFTKYFMCTERNETKWQSN